MSKFVFVLSVELYRHNIVADGYTSAKQWEKSARETRSNTLGRGGGGEGGWNRTKILCGYEKRNA